MTRFLHTEEVGDVLVVRIERPPANAMSPDLLDEGAELVEELRGSPPGAVVITAGNCLTGGGDLSADRTLALSGSCSQLLTFSGGVDLKLVPSLPEAERSGADYRIASSTASYGITELRVGTPFPAAAIGVIRAELEPAAVRRMVLGADLIDGATAHDWGVVDELAEGEDGVLERSLEVARGFAKLPSRTYELVKRQLRGEALERMLAASQDDPLAAGWLTDEAPDAARAVLDRERDQP